MNDPEMKALTVITEALTALEDDQRRNVLLYVNTRYRYVPSQRSAGRSNEPIEQESSSSDAKKFDNMGDMFDVANPQTEAERVLAVAYWLHIQEGADDFESFPVNKHLKQLGHPVSNITRALDGMIGQTPRLVLQTSKSGSSKQARKRYKLTREGIKRVRSMLAANGGDHVG